MYNLFAYFLSITEISDMKNRTEQLLMKLGCLVYYKGFNYLKDIVDMACEDNSAIHNLSARVYPRIAMKYSATPAAIEHAIRTVIKRSWDDDPNRINGISAWKLNAQPSVKDFLSIVIGHLKYFTEE